MLVISLSSIHSYEHDETGKQMFIRSHKMLINNPLALYFRKNNA